MLDDFEVIAEFAYPFEAELAAGRLEAGGLEARTEKRGVLGTSWLNPGRAGGIVLMVKTDQSEEARALLKAIEEDFEPEVPPEYSEDAEILECPECGSPHKKFKREHPIVGILPLSGSLERFKGHRWVCRGCGHIWMVDEEPGF